jgi:hypothetical protein
VPTHEIVNQPAPLVDWDVAADATLESALVREGAGWAAEAQQEIDRRAGSARRDRRSRPGGLTVASTCGRRGPTRRSLPGLRRSVTHGTPWGAARRTRWGAGVGRTAGECRRGRLKG